MSNKIEFKLNQLFISGKRVVTDDLSRFRIGCIYFFEKGVDPIDEYGGNWERIEGKFLLGEGGGYVNGVSGGSADAVVVSHNHSIYSLTDNPLVSWGTNVGGSATFVGPVGGTAKYTSGSAVLRINLTGVDGTGKNMPPYIVENIWRRTA